MYYLHVDLEHITENNPYDAELIEFPGCENVRFSNPAIDEYARGAPRVIEFVGNLDMARELDYLATRPYGYLLVSKRLIRTVQSVSLFRHELFPTIIYSREIGHLVMDEDTAYRTAYEVRDPSLYNTDFVILKMRETLDGLDEDRTIVRGGVSLRQSEEKYHDQYSIEHFEFREPEGGFPPVFHARQLVFYCYTEAAKQACERAGLKGLAFEPLP
jgi:hypothetical protein